MAYVQGSTTDNPIVSLGKLGFIELRDSLRQYMESSEVFTDYDFEGSALSTLIDVLSYNSTFYSYYANMVANESFIDTAVKKSSLGSLVKPLSYTPVSRRSARAEINLTGDGFVHYGDPITGGGLNWTPIKSYKIYSGVTTKIEIVQGNRIQTSPEQDVVDSSINHQRFRIPHEEIDTSTLKVSVDENGWNEWRAIDQVEGNISGVTAGDKVYFLTTSFDGGYEIYFGDNVVGKSPVHNSKVMFEYIIGAGEEGNGVVTFTSGIPKITVNSTVTASHSGVNNESNESIRTFAPLFFQTQGRAVTANDFRSLLRQERKGVISKIWGGEDNVPPQYGRVFVSAYSEEGQLLTDEQKQEIIAFFKSKAVVSILPEFADPSFIEISLSDSITVNLDLTYRSRIELEDLIFGFIETYYHPGFDVSFNLNDMENEIRKLDNGIIGTENIDVKLIKHTYASPSKPITSVTINYDNPLDVGGSPGDIVESVNSFMAKRPDTGEVVPCVLRDRLGIIELGTAGNEDPPNFANLLADVGSLNRETGTVQIDGVEIYSPFSILARPLNENVYPKASTIFRLVNDGIFIDEV
jgi:hypothetical protein